MNVSKPSTNPMDDIFDNSRPIRPIRPSSMTSFSPNLVHFPVTLAVSPRLTPEVYMEAYVILRFM